MKLQTKSVLSSLDRIYPPVHPAATPDWEPAGEKCVLSTNAHLIFCHNTVNLEDLDASVSNPQACVMFHLFVIFHIPAQCRC